jgi:hypothetical protein
VVTSEGTGPVTEPVLPSSRQPVPGSERYERPVATPRDTDGEGGDGDRAKRRTAAQIEADIDATTERLAASVDELTDRLNPARIARSGVSKAKSLVTGPDGRPRAEVVGAVVGALVGAALLIWRSRRR